MIYIHQGCVLVTMTCSYLGQPVMHFGTPVGDLLSVRSDQTTTEVLSGLSTGQIGSHFQSSLSLTTKNGFQYGVHHKQLAQQNSGPVTVQ